MTRTTRYLVGIGTGIVVDLFAIALVNAVWPDCFHSFKDCRRLLFERPQKHPPAGVWRNSQIEHSPALFRLPDTDLFFAEYHCSDAQFMTLRTERTYETAVRMHFGGMILDRGHWQVTKTGDIVLRSDMQYHDLPSDDLWYLSVNSDTLADLPMIKARVQDFLERTPGESFPFATVKAIHRHPVRNNPQKTYSAFTCFHPSPVRRQSLQRLLAQIDEYLAWPDKNAFHFRPVTYKSYVFLVDLDAKFPSQKEQIVQFKNRVDGLTGSQIPWDTYIALTRERFAEETGRAEPFKTAKPGWGWFR